MEGMESNNASLLSPTTCSSSYFCSASDLEQQQQQRHNPPPSAAAAADESGSLDDCSSSFCAEPRGRCYTWPVPQQDSTSSSLLHQHSTIQPSCSSRLPSLASLSPSSGQQQQFCFAPLTEEEQPKPKPKRIRRRTDGTTGTASGKKPNPWGEESYSDLIARALGAALEGRLKLNEIYQWFSDNIPYFAARSSQEDAQGWKNSIRHNLSLHSRFMRIQNEGAGKSSWWVINPDAKPGRNPRRRANTMENASKVAMDKKRRGARKRVEQLVQHKGTGGPCSSSAMASMQELFPGGEAQEPMAGGELGCPQPEGNFDTFRPRAQSTLSVVGPSRLSPKLEPAFEDIDFPPWMEQQSSQPPPSTTQQQQQMNPQVNELLDRTDQMRLEAIGQPSGGTAMNGVKMDSRGPMMLPKTEMMEPGGGVKQERSPSVIPPPSYQELSAVRRSTGGGQQSSMPMQLPMQQMGTPPQQQQQQQMVSPLKMSVANSLLSGVPSQPPPLFASSMPQQPMFGNFQWNPAMLAQQFGGIPGNNGNGALPLDLENVNAMPVDPSLMASMDLDAVLRNELAQGGHHSFDLP